MDIFDEYADRAWVDAVVGLSNLLGRLDVIRERQPEHWSSSTLLQDLWYESEMALELDDFNNWFASVGRSVVTDRVVIAGDRRRLTPHAEKLVKVMSGLIIQNDLSDAELSELIERPVQRLAHSLAGCRAPLNETQSVWDDLLDAEAVDDLVDEFTLNISSELTTSEMFSRLVSERGVRELRSATTLPIASLLSSLVREEHVPRLTAALNCGNDQILEQLVVVSRARERAQNATDLFAAEQTRIRIMDLVRAASHGVLTVLQQAGQVEDHESSHTSLAQCAGFMCLRRNFRQAVKALIGMEDTYDTFSAAHAARLLEQLLSGNDEPSVGDLSVTEPFTRQVAIVLEAVDFYPFEGDRLDVSSRALNESHRYRLLLPIAATDDVRKVPLSSEQFVSNLRENLLSEDPEMVEV